MKTTKLVNVELTDADVKRALVLLMREHAITNNSTKLETYAKHLELKGDIEWSIEYDGQNWQLSMDGELSDD